MGMFLGLLTAFIWGAYFALSRAGVAAGLRASDITCLRYAVAGALLSVWFLRRRPGMLNGMTWPRACIMTFLAGPPFILFSVNAYAFAPLAHGALLQPGAMTTASAMLAFFLLGEPVGRWRIVGTAIILAGLAITAGESLGRVDAWTLVGDLMFAWAGFQWALFATLTRRWAVSPMAATACVSVLSAAIFVPYYLAVDGPARLLALPWPMLATQGIAQGVLSGVVAVAAYAAAVERVGAGRAGIFGAMVPAIGILLGIPIAGEWPTLLQLAGVAVVTFGTLLSGGLLRLPSRSGVKPPKRAALAERETASR